MSSRIAEAIGAIHAKDNGARWEAYARATRKRYEPRPNDPVIGLVQDRTSEAYRVEIPGASMAGVLPLLAFDGASLRNRPNLQPGDCVHARVAECRPGLELDLTCKEHEEDEAKGWMTADARFTTLKRGPTSRLEKCTPQFARHLIDASDEAAVLVALRRHYEHVKIVVGANGIVWIHAPKTVETTVVANALANAARIPEAQVASMVDKLVATVHAQVTLAGVMDVDDDDDDDYDMPLTGS